MSEFSGCQEKNSSKGKDDEIPGRNRWKANMAVQWMSLRFRASNPLQSSPAVGNERQTMVPSALSKSNLALPLLNVALRLLVGSGPGSGIWRSCRGRDRVDFAKRERSRTTLASRVRGWIRDDREQLFRFNVLLVGDGLLASIFVPGPSIFIKMRNGSSQTWCRVQAAFNLFWRVQLLSPIQALAGMDDTVTVVQ